MRYDQRTPEIRPMYGLNLKISQCPLLIIYNSALLIFKWGEAIFNFPFQIYGITYTFFLLSATDTFELLLCSLVFSTCTKPFCTSGFVLISYTIASESFINS